MAIWKPLEPIVKLKKMKLNHNALANLKANSNLFIPDLSARNFPERVLQFGTGVLLRALPDFIIDKANQSGNFDGKIVMVKSTNAGDSNDFKEQDGLFTVCVRGRSNGLDVAENHLISSVSRVLNANEEWNSILQLASSPNLEFVFSNTTEVGISKVKDSIYDQPPVSFPGKLLSFLYNRFTFFKGDSTKGLIIIPTELILDNGKVLNQIILELAKENSLSENFIDWLNNCNYFCNSLVDRIVPGKLSNEDKLNIEQELGYQDELMIMSEVYQLWAIEVPRNLDPTRIRFAKNNPAVIVATNIEKYRELKLRLLNAAHTFSCGIALFAGFNSVKEAMDNQPFSTFLEELMKQEIIPVMISKEISESDAESFAQHVLDRFRNNYIEHLWINISVQYAAKMQMRNIDLMKRYLLQQKNIPEHMLIGFAAFLLWMKCSINADGDYIQSINGRDFIVQDIHAGLFASAWKSPNIWTTVNQILSDENIWGEDLTKYISFTQDVVDALNKLIKDGVSLYLKSAAIA